MNLKREVYDKCILSVTMYGMETTQLARQIADCLRIAERAIERAILEISLRE